MFLLLIIKGYYVLIRFTTNHESHDSQIKSKLKGRYKMFEFRINFKNRTCYGDHYTVWYWNPVQNAYITIIDKVYYAGSTHEVLSMIKNEVKFMFGLKRARWEINNYV